MLTLTNNLILNNHKPIDYFIHSWKNVFSSNKYLNEEIQYVHERKNSTGCQGKSLEKLYLLLNTQFNSNTVTEIYDVKVGTSYK